MTDEQEERRKEREHQMHAHNIGQPPSDTDPKTLKYVSEIDDGPELRDDAMNYQHSRVVSTANLEDTDVEGIEWHTEIAMLRRRQAYPPKHGITGIARAFAMDSADEYREPMGPIDTIKHEGHGFLTQLAGTRSEDFIGVETSTSETRESIISGTDESGGGIRGRIRR